MTSPEPTATMSTKDIWQRVSAQLEQQLSPAAFNTWIVGNPLTQFEVISENEAIGTISSPSAFHSASLQKMLLPHLQQALLSVTGKNTKLEFVVGTPVASTPPSPSRPLANSFSDAAPGATLKATPPAEESQFHPQSTTSPRVEDLFSPQTIQASSIAQADFQAQKAGLKRDFTFNTFAVSTTNEMAHAAATAVSNTPGTAYNPLFLYGGVGVGKTHLMHAIGNNILARNPSATVLYLTGEEFTNQIVSAIQTKRAIEFKSKYRSANVLLIDDVQFIAGKTAVQEEFFHTFNAVIKQHGQIVLTSDRPPHEINLLEDRLRSRFEAGLMIDIQQPTFELRTAILLIKAKAIQLHIPMDIAQLIASRVDSARKIEGVLTKIRSAVELQGREVNAELVSAMVNAEQTQPLHRLRVSPTDVIKSVSDHFHIKQTVLKGQRRVKAIVTARHVAMYFLKNDVGLPYTEIGRWFSNRDHTSALHAVQKIELHLTTDQQLRQDVDAIRTTLSSLAK